jgi:hypothetical protein
LSAAQGQAAGTDEVLTMQEARRLTNEVKADAVALWEKMIDLYRQGVHTALSYSSWAEYCAEEFEMSDATAYRLLQAARVIEELPIGSQRPASESVARELAPLLDEPEALAETWHEAVEEHGTPTAKQVKAKVETKRPRAKATRNESRSVNAPSKPEQPENNDVIAATPPVDENAINGSPEPEPEYWHEFPEDYPYDRSKLPVPWPPEDGNDFADRSKLEAMISDALNHLDDLREIYEKCKTNAEESKALGDAFGEDHPARNVLYAGGLWPFLGLVLNAQEERCRELIAAMDPRRVQELAQDELGWNPFRRVALECLSASTGAEVAA